MTTITFTYDGGPRCLAQHVESGDIINTDAPLDNGGTGSSFSPTDLVAAGLGACMAVYLGKAAEKHEWSMLGTKMIIKKEMVADPLRRIGRLVVDIYLNRTFDDKEMKILTNAVTTCPVKLSISDEIQVPITFYQPDN